MAEFIGEHFVPFTVNIHDKPALFGRFRAFWTPTVLVMSHKGMEEFRIEGYLPSEEFRPALEMALGRVSLTAKRWEDARAWYAHVIREHGYSSWAPEAIYWSGVCQYNASNDAAPLGETAMRLRSEYPGSLWTRKAAVWLPEGVEARRESGARLL